MHAPPRKVIFAERLQGGKPDGHDHGLSNFDVCVNVNSSAKTRFPPAIAAGGTAERSVHTAKPAQACRGGLLCLDAIADDCSPSSGPHAAKCQDDAAFANWRC